VGLLPDLIADLESQGLTARELDPLFSSAEGYVKMWERAESFRKLPDTTPPVLTVPSDTCLRPGTVLDYASGVVAVDNIDPNSQVSCGPPSPIMFPTAGTYPVFCLS
jgi:hypothetical protein